MRQHMRVTGYCNICCVELEDIPHALFRYAHANRLWSDMRKVWNLPTDVELCLPPDNWFRYILNHISAHMIDPFLLLTWRI
jgi:hypothetical protein